MTKRVAKRERGAGRVYLRPGSKTYMASWHEDGVEIRRSTGATNEQDAYRFLRLKIGEREAGKETGVPTGEAQVCTFEEMKAMLEADYKRKGNISWGRASRALKHLSEFFGRDRANDITTERVHAYEAARLKAGAARATLNNELAPLRRMFRLAFGYGRVQRVPIIETPDPKDARQGFLSREDVYRVAEKLDDDMRPLWLFLYESGWRPQDLCGRLPDRAGGLKRGTALQWSDVDLKAGRVRRQASETKNGQPKMFPLVPGSDAEAILLAQRERTTARERASGRIIPWVFNRADGSPIIAYSAPLRAALDAAGLPDRVPYDVKRTAARRFSAGGLTEQEAMHVMGLRTPSIYRRYNVTVEADAREGLDRMYRSERGPARKRKDGKR
jgi:integrase